VHPLAADLDAEGIAQRASDIDVVYRNGYGFPAHRGGPMFAADMIGLKEALDRMADYRKGYMGQFWKPAQLLVETRLTFRLAQPVTLEKIKGHPLLAGLVRYPALPGDA